jgi:hypothetical protein
MRNALEYYNKAFNFGYLTREQQQDFMKRNKLSLSQGYAKINQAYRDFKFQQTFKNASNYLQLSNLGTEQKNELLDNALVNESIGKFFTKDNTSEDNLTRINQLTLEGKKELLNSDYDPSDKYYNQNPLETIALGATMGAGVGAWFGGIGAIPGAVAGAKYGAIASIGDALVSNLYNNNTESKLNDIVAKDNDRKKEQAQKITPQVSNLLGSITNGDIFKDANAMQQAAPILQELKAYGVDVSKGEASNLDALFNKVVAKNNSYYDVFKDRHELSDLTNGDKMNMIVQTLATDLTFNDGGYSSMSINNQDLQNHISKNQSAGDWGFNTAKNVVVGTVGALGETVAGIAAAGAYGYDKVNNALGGNSHLTNDILEGKDVPLLLNLAYWDGVDKFNTFDPDIIKKARENGGISPYNNVSLAGDEGRFFSWESLNENVKMLKYVAANRITGGVLGQASKLAKNTTQYAASKLGMEATKALNLGNNVGKWSAMGTYMTGGVPVAAGYGLGAYEDTKQKFTEKEDTRQAKELLKSYLNTKEYNDKVAERAKELMQPRMVEGKNTNLTSKETATMMAKDQVGKEMAAYFTDYVKNNRDKVANNNKDFKSNRDNIERIATDAFALDATIEAAKNTFVNINYKSYLFGKQTNQLLKGEQSGIKPYNPRMVEQRYNPLTKRMETVPSRESGNLFYNPETKQLQYQEAPRKAGWKAVKNSIWGGFISNYTDDLTTGAVEGAAAQRYDNYLDQKYNKDAVNSVVKFLGNLYSTSNAFLQGGEEKMADNLSFYDGFIGALGFVVPGSGRLFKHSPYESTDSRSTRSKGSKLLERVLSTTGIGNAYYDAKYQDIANGKAVSQINEILSHRSLDLNDILDLASATNLAESSIENGTLSDAKTAKDRAFLSTLLFLSREKGNPIVQAHPAIQNALKAINAIREGTLGTDKANEETKALYENMKQDFLKESSNKDDASLPQEQAEAAAEKRLQHNISKAKTIIDSMDETMAKLQIDHPNISQDALDFVTTTKVMADSYDARMREMEKSLGLPEGSTVSHKQDVNDILALYSNKKLQETRLKEIQYNKEHLTKQIEELEEDLSNKKTRKLSGGKALLKASIEALKEHRDNLTIEENLIKEASTHLDENGNHSRVFTEQEVENMDADSRAYLFSRKDKLSPEQKKVLDNLEQKYLEKGVSNVEEYMNDLAKLKNSREGNMKAFTDSSKNPEIAQELVLKKQNEFLRALLNTRAELRGDALEGELNSINPNILTGNKAEQSDYQAALPVLYKYDNNTLDKILSRYKDNEALANAVNSVKEVNNFKSKILPALTEAPGLSQSVDNILINSLKHGNSIDAEFESVFNSDAVDDATKSALRKAYNKAKGIESTEKSTVTETKEEKKARQESQETQAKQEEKKIQDAETKAQEAIEVTSKEESNDKNAQEAYTETEQERKNQEEAEKQVNTYEQTEEDIARDKAVEQQKKEGVDFSTGTIDFNSPNWEEQVEQAEAEGHKVEEGVVPKGTIDTTDQGNTSTSTSENMLGNAMYGYDVKALEEDAKEVKRTGKDPNDKMSRFFNWFKTAKIELQEIIDNELKDIIKANNKLEVLYVNPQANATDDAALNDFSLLCVEYTDAVKRIHNEDRGGVITANDKQYLVVGTMGFDRTNSAQGNTYRSILYQGKKNRYKYFTENPSERFFVDPSGHTEVEQMTSGRIVREMVGDEGTKVRPVTELLSDPNRNPKRLKLQDLKWGIMFEDGLHYANISSRNTVYPPRDTMSNLGAVFLLMEAANGNYIPAAIRPTMLSDLQDGALKTQLNTLFNELTSVNYADRVKAIKQLVQLLNLSSDGENNILIGMKDKPTVSTVKNGVVLRTFNVADPNFNRMDLVEAINELNPRVNITLSTLSDPVQLKMYAEAGALSTDIAKLGTSNASYTVYAMDKDGNPIKTKPIENGTPNLDANSDLERADYKKKHSVYHKGTQYREKNGKWYDANWKEVTEPILLSQIKWASYIRANDLAPSLVSNDKYGNKNNKYYIINSDDASAKVIKVFENGSIAELSTADSRTVINAVREKEAKATREKVAKEENKRLEQLNSLTEQEKKEIAERGEDVDLGETLTDEQLIAQGNGDFESTAKPQPTDSEVKAQEVVDRIATDTHDIVLNETGNIYTDSTGKEYARVTSIIQATEGAERFDPDSPWVLPSTKIGIGVDEFVRDFFAGKLGNLENLHERYPNASLSQLQAFEKQLRELKASFDKRGLTIVPRDVTVTGEVEVTDANGKKYKLSVAGTLDLLAYDKDGNFYIFDMKTNRSAPNDKKASKWNKQLSLYKQFLEEKYGISVKGTEIIPIEVSYPAPKGWSNATTEYSNNGNQLYANRAEYRDARPTLHSNIPITTSPVKVEYNLLTNEERSMLSPITDGTFNFTTGTTNKESVNKSKEDINKTGNKSLAELQASANASPTDVNSVLRNRTYGRKVREILKEKGFSGKPSEAEAWLKEHNMPISNITDVDAWIDMLQNCR